MEYNGPKFIINDLPFIDNDKPGGGFKKVEFLYAIDGDTCNFIIDKNNSGDKNENIIKIN